jgi:peptidyl-prolyl cis-trans isomerase C
VIKLNGTREKPKPALVEVRTQLVEQLQAEAVNKHLETVELTADIQRPYTEFDPAIIRQIELLAD